MASPFDVCIGTALKGAVLCLFIRLSLSLETFTNYANIPV
jgi:hypothetical protein